MGKLTQIKLKWKNIWKKKEDESGEESMTEKEIIYLVQLNKYNINGSWTIYVEKNCSIFFRK